MTRVAVLGAGGMLGAALIRHAREFPAIEAIAWTRLHVYDIADPASLELAIKRDRPQVIINAAGAIPSKATPTGMIHTNASGPHMVAMVAAVHGIRVVHISTDCVFADGQRTDTPGVVLRRRAADIPDATSFYGRTKALGEVDAEHVTNVRTSFVGPEHGLWAWAIEQVHRTGTVEVWPNAKWSGSTVGWVAIELLRNLDALPPGAVHLSTGLVQTKAHVIRVILQAYGLRLDAMVPNADAWQDRTLAPDILLPTVTRRGVEKEVSFRP